MRPLKRARSSPETGLPLDPAPSRIAYRLNRLWLSPAFRRMVKIGLPVLVLCGVSGAVATRPTVQEAALRMAADVEASVKARPEFQIRQMAITGASPELSDAIRERVALKFPVSWFELDPAAVHASVSELDAVADLKVSLELGGALRLDVRQREPAVIWRRPAGLELLDGTGHRVATIDRRDGRPELPLITGPGADRAVPEALELHAAATPIWTRLRGLTRQGERRWDLVLDRDQVIKLPADDPLPALRRVLAMDEAMDLLARDISVVDLRRPDRPTIRLGPAAVDSLHVTRAFEKELTGQ